MTAERSAVRIERIIPAPPHLVYRAWLEPELICRWMYPGGMWACGRAEVDARVGGHYRIWHTDASTGTEVGGFEGEVLELVPDQRILFRWGFGRPGDTDPEYDSLLTITLAEVAGGFTALTLVHERLDALAVVVPQIADGVEGSWQIALDNLVTLTEAESARSTRL